VNEVEVPDNILFNFLKTLTDARYKLLFSLVAGKPWTFLGFI